MGTAQGLYVASSEDGSSHMMALSTNFGNHASQDGLRFFGVHRLDAPESHIAVIGGTGKYHGANGYAIVKVLDLGSHDAADVAREANTVLPLNIYLS
ncbi:hypothetical protein HS088_TW09G00695 [Tripterygium wilfordii]|uniref:Dirigent protein n=1 Tax=Tripterygium wilfordii TaxID=458696 RepID=A0A7J7D8K6_TRIWF|nr:hypothetical protein HS088_TW09G00695 [Tripterygium wilfordii]